MFSDADYQLLKNRQVKQRKPVQHPQEQDIEKLHDFTLHKMKILQEKSGPWSSSEFCELRNLVVSRLTLYNARRGGDPCRLDLLEWKDAEEGNWIEARDSSNVKDPLENHLLATTKIAYQTGKGPNRLVSVLIPEDCIAPLKLLADPMLRTTCGVHCANKYVFPFTQGSLDHLSGWQCLGTVAKEAQVECPNKITATETRYLTSTMYAMLDVSPLERQRFFEHMGHSEEINKQINKTPLALSTVKTVGKHLFRFDKGR